MANVQKRFRERGAPADVIAASEECRKKCGRPKVGVEVEEGVKALLEKNNDTAWNFQRKIAKKLNVTTRYEKS